MSPRNNLLSALQALIGDKYDVEGRVGGGGMAEVFLARHRTHGGLFAVKVLAEHLAGDPNVVARFLAEARTAATLSGHPNIAPIFDVGEGSGVYYLIMPFIEGEDVSNYLERHGRLTAGEAVSIVRQVAEALVWAGDRNVVHRDLKPSNIRIDASGRVIVLDFGIAKAGDEPSVLTTQGETPGTPYYMSPEQIGGERCGPASDLYSLGVVFFELLTGLKPFDGDSARAIETGHRNRLPPALSTILPVDPQVEQIVNRLLEKNPSDRYLSARELAAELDTVAARLPAARLLPQMEDRAQVERPAGPVIAEILEPRKRWQRQWPRPRALAPWVAGGAVAVAVIIWLASGPKVASSDRKETSKPTNSETSRKLPRSTSDAHGAMLLVAGGPFVFGEDSPQSPNQRQQVTLPPFYVDATAVSNARYAGFVKATGRQAPESPTFRASPNLPVTVVTFTDAAAYCGWAGRRLPAEQEWEKAARGPDGAIYPWGNQPLPSPGKLVPVDEYPERQSPAGALNMVGNVFEWTTTAFPVTQREIDDMRKQTGRREVSHEWFSVKGGSSLVGNEQFFRSYMRRGWPVDQGSPAIGFRCVKDAN